MTKPITKGVFVGNEAASLMSCHWRFETVLISTLRPPQAQSSHFSEHLDEYLTVRTAKTASPITRVGFVA